MQNRSAYALLMFDYQGCGREDSPLNSLEDQTNQKLADTGWGDRATTIIIDPELEIWLWSDSPHVDKILGWQGKQPDLRTWLKTQALWKPEDKKPFDPKKSVEACIIHSNIPRSSSLYKRIAECVSLNRCTDKKFLQLRRTLSNWFGAS
ncbi:MAG: hypothetical protein AB9866_29945 [Syntrophobacteraceae bacterium]